MNALNSSLSAVHVAAFDCSGLSTDIRKGVEAMLAPFHPRHHGITLNQRLLEQKDTVVPVTFRQRRATVFLWFFRREDGGIRVHEMGAAGLVGD